jgi:hypothetical protein
MASDDDLVPVEQSMLPVRALRGCCLKPTFDSLPSP